MKYIPNFRFEPPPVYFMHIPKTAGTSLMSLLRSTYALGQTVTVHVTHLHLLNSTTLGNYRFFRSHAGPSLLPFIPHRRLQCITMLREPVELSLSTLYYLQFRVSNHPAEFEPEYLARMRAKPLNDLSCWLDELEANPQTRFLGALNDLSAYFSNGQIGKLQQPLLQPIRLPSLVDESDMDQVAARAHKQLEGLAVACLTERFAESVALVCELLGIELPKKLPEKNIGPRKTGVLTENYRATIPRDLVARIEAMNRHDQELYSHACELFKLQMARHRARRRRTISIAPLLRSRLQPARQLSEQAGRVIAMLRQPAPRKAP